MSLKFLIYQFNSNGIPVKCSGQFAHNNFAVYGMQSIQKYAETLGVDYQLLTTVDSSIINNYYYGIFYPFKNDMYNEYDAVCFFDTDVLATTTAVNIFDYYDPNLISVHNTRIRDLEFDPSNLVMYNPHPSYPKEGVMNSGVVIFPKAVYQDMKDLTLLEEYDGGKYGPFDQTLINLYCIEKGYVNLPKQLNHVIHKAGYKNRFVGTSFIHYAMDTKQYIEQDFLDDRILK